jgi:outer membrane protein OmpA-like peptidoglycan-associated protein
MTHHRQGGIAAIVVIALAMSACASTSKKTQGTAAGVGVGGIVGAVIGHQTGSTAKGAIIGAAVGGAAGMIIGARMDQQAKELDQSITGATVERVGEGIQVTFASGLLYDFDSDRVRAEAGTNLRNLAASLSKYPDTELLIVGHTDATGSDDYNQALSLRRASAAMDYLIAQGVRPSRLHAAGRGELEPVATNDTDAGRQSNRRVEIAIFADAAAKRGGTN